MAGYGGDKASKGFSMDRAVRKAAPRLRRDFGEVEQLQVSRKGPADFVSMADKRAEETLIAELRNARSDWGILAEESGEIEGNPSRLNWRIFTRKAKRARASDYPWEAPHVTKKAHALAIECSGRRFAG